MRKLAASAACLVAGFGAAQSPPSPDVFPARGMRPGATLSLSQSFSSWRGRSLGITEGLLVVVPDPKWMLWYSRQDFSARGRNSANRFDVESDTFGLRAVVREPGDFDSRYWAFQVESFHPSSGTSRMGSTTAIFRGTRNISVAALMSDEDGDYRLGYTSVRGAASGSANVFDVGYGRDFAPSEKWTARLQGSAVMQSFQGGTALKLVLYGSANYQLSPHFSIQGEATLMPFGVPMAHGRLTPLSSFFVYNPGGAVDSLQDDFVAVAGLRLMLGYRF